MATETKAPKGFAGLDDLISEVEIAVARPVYESNSAGTSTLPGTSPDRPNSSAAKVPGWAYGVGVFVVIGVIVAINQATYKKPPPSDKFIENPQPASYDPPPLKPVEIVEKAFYTLRGSDGSRVEVEGPVHATPEQLNALGQSKWRPSEQIPPEEKPDIGQGLLLEDNQIRYCLSQKIRMGGWEITVESTDHKSVAAFNAQVDDYNSRCGHFQYKTGALERVRAQVESRRAYLDVDGRLHRGPRLPERTPTFKLVSRKESNGK